MSKNSHTAMKDAARELADVEGLTYTEARRIVERWTAHEGPTDDELRAADETEFDPSYYYARTTSEIPGFLMRMHDYPLASAEPAKYCHPHPVQSLADPGQEAVLSLTARSDVYYGEPALVVEPLTFTSPPGALPGFGHWGNCWTIHLHDVGFLDRVSNLAAPGWSATITRGPEPSAPCHLRLAHEDGYVLFDAETPLPPDWLARVHCNPEGVPVFCGPGAGRPVPRSVDHVPYVNSLLDTLDLVAARVPFTVAGVA
jgi:hypothetical protein